MGSCATTPPLSEPGWGLTLCCPPSPFFFRVSSFPGVLLLVGAMHQPTCPLTLCVPVPACLRACLPACTPPPLTTDCSVDTYVCLTDSDSGGSKPVGLFQAQCQDGKEAHRVANPAGVSRER